MGHYEGRRYNSPSLPRVHIGKPKQAPAEPPRALNSAQQADVRKAVMLLNDIKETRSTAHAMLNVSEVFKITREISRQLQSQS